MILAGVRFPSTPPLAPSWRAKKASYLETLTMHRFIAAKRLGFAVGLIVVGFLPNSVEAQSGTWVTTVTSLGTAGGAADVIVEKRNDKQSRAKITFRNTNRDLRLGWDIVKGNCRDEGLPIAPQAAFTQIQTHMDGSGTASANIPKLESGQDYYIRVFDPQTAVTDASAFGCANLSEKP